MARCALCGKSGFFLSVRAGACGDCLPKIQEEAAIATETIARSEKAAGSAKTIDTRVSHYERIIALFQRFIVLQEKGIGVRPIVRNTGEASGDSVQAALEQHRSAMDDDIVESLEAEARDAEAKVSATRSESKKRQILERVAERVRYFRTKMFTPARLAGLEARVAGAFELEARCAFCEQLRGRGETCRSCGATQ